MKKKYLAIVAVMSCSLFYFGNDYISSASSNEDEKIDNLFETDLYDNTEMKFGITSMGVSKSEKIFSIRMDGDNMSNKEKAKLYFEKELASNGITNYKVEILNLEK
ncbi:hypothetical protein M3197_12900 [Sporosarcina aquimarina]|uniref:hypothetical protein n=1 Tax=Sporosarcina aquimarina TaxID=114975 RepID=UPI00203CE2A5|nr:hypothetical protein [Sporosarcina aquimarina]MCM3758361.1 hypothetical protein [Sporosarcina aquimarina]